MLPEDAAATCGTNGADNKKGESVLDSPIDGFVPLSRSTTVTSLLDIHEQRIG